MLTHQNDSIMVGKFSWKKYGQNLYQKLAEDPCLILVNS